MKPCPFCGREVTARSSLMPDGHMILTTIRCIPCGLAKSSVYSPGIVNKPRDANATALALATKAWNRRAKND